MTNIERKKRLDALGYTLFNNATDCFGKKWKYKKSPSNSGGSTCYFNSLEEVDKHIIKVEQIREWQKENKNENKTSCG